MMAERILLMCDYSADPVWYESDGTMAALEALPLDEATKAQLRRWADWYETFRDDGLEWESDEEEQAFEHEGRRLWKKVRAELGEGWQVGYFSETQGSRVWDPAELS